MRKKTHTSEAAIAVIPLRMDGLMFALTKRHYRNERQENRFNWMTNDCARKKTAVVAMSGRIY